MFNCIYSTVRLVVFEQNRKYALNIQQTRDSIFFGSNKPQGLLCDPRRCDGSSSTRNDPSCSRRLDMYTLCVYVWTDRKSIRYQIYIVIKRRCPTWKDVISLPVDVRRRQCDIKWKTKLLIVCRVETEKVFDTFSPTAMILMREISLGSFQLKV